MGRQEVGEHDAGGTETHSAGDHPYVLADKAGRLVGAGYDGSRER